MEAAFTVILMPFRGTGPLIPLLVLSFLSGLLMLWAFGKWSDQEQIRKTKELIRGQLLGVRLYQHDVRVVLRLQASILRQVANYFRLSLSPMVVLLLPILLILVQLNLFFSHRPLDVGQPTILKVRTDDRVGPTSAIGLRAPDGITIETAAVHSSRAQEVSWRVRADRPGAFEAVIESEGQSLTKTIVAGSRWAAVSPIRTRDWFDLLFFSGEPPLPDSSGLTSIELLYPTQSISFLGWQTDWLVVFLIASLVTAFLMKGFFGVEI
jgi:hypothetical protein